MRKPIIAANWKMNKTVTEALEFLREFYIEIGNEVGNEIEKTQATQASGIDILIIPPFTALKSVNEIAERAGIILGAQDCHWELEGAFTGEVSAVMLKDVGCRYVIVGHSERRKIFGESDEIVNRKVKAVLQEGLKPILCVGETAEEREAGKTRDVITRQVRAGLAGIGNDEASSVVIAYEPVWAIGSGQPARPEDAVEVANLVRAALHGEYGNGVAESVRIQYGGSVKPSNIWEFMQFDEIDGALIGGASLDPRSFASMVITTLQYKSKAV